MIKNYYRPVAMMSGFLKAKKIHYKVFRTKEGGAFHYPDAEINKHLNYLLTEVECFKDIYKPLFFFNSLYEILELVLKNSDQPDSVRVYLRDLTKNLSIKDYFLAGSLHFLLCKLNHSYWMLPPYEDIVFDSAKSKTIEDIAMFLDDIITDIYDSIVTDISYNGGLYEFLPNEFELIYGKNSQPDIRGEMLTQQNPIIEITKGETTTELLNGAKEKQTVQEETISEKLSAALDKYKFFDLPEMSLIKPETRKYLIDLLAAKGASFSVALFDHVGFIKFLKREYFKGNKRKTAAEIAYWFGLNLDLNGKSRQIEGYLNVLNKYSQENTRLYQTREYKENVKRAIYDLKRGVRPL